MNSEWRWQRRRKFTQKERDNETGLDYFLARYYSNTQGRFTSPDEFKGGAHELWVLGSGDPKKQALVYADVTNPQSLNKYQYTFNNPLRYVDPDGQHPQDPLALDWDVKDLAAGRISEQEFRDRQTARGIGGAAAVAVVTLYLWGPEAATAIISWAMRNPEKANQIAEEAVQASSGNPTPSGAVTGLTSAEVGLVREARVAEMTGGQVVRKAITVRMLVEARLMLSEKLANTLRWVDQPKRETLVNLVSNSPS